MTILKPKVFHSAVCAMLLLGTPVVFADALIKPLPTPDTAKLAPELVKELASARTEFDKARVGLVGDGLAAAYALIGAEYARAGLNEPAAIAFYDASQLSPKDSRWLYLRGVIARVQKLHADARADFEAALALDQVYLPIRYRLADTLIDLGDLDGAKKLLEAALAKNGDQAALWAMLGRLDLSQKRYGAAIEHLRQALKLEPQANALYRDLADAYSGQGNAQQAKEALAGVGPNAPSIPDPLVTGMYGSTPSPQGSALEQARDLAARGQFGQARAKAAEAMVAHADDVDALALAARLDGLLGRHASAQELASRALKLKPESANANLSQGMVYEFAGDDANAYIHYQRAVRADGNVADARVLLGNALMRRNQFAAAAGEYRQLVALTSGSIESESRLTAALVAAGHCEEALAQINAEQVKRAQDGDLMEIFVRLASTCAAAKPAERSMAIDYAMELYKQRPNAGESAALALANAAQGKFDEAQKYQAEAIYEAVRASDNRRADMYRTTMHQFAAKQVPDRPWPAEHPYFKPPLLTVLPRDPSAP